jgi:hypothetical protein
MMEDNKPKETKLSETWDDYPCDACEKNAVSCTVWLNCMAWRRWFSRIWKEIRRRYGR